MRIRLRPIDWLEGYKEQQAAAMVKSGIQRTLFSYGLIRGVRPGEYSRKN